MSKKHIDNYITLSEVANAVGVKYHTFRAWIQIRPDVKEKYVVEKKNGWLIHKTLIADYRSLRDAAD